MDKLEIGNILKLKSLNSELEFERANSLYLKLRLSVKENEHYITVRKHLYNLIKDYEARFWEDEDKITDEQIRESDIAETLVWAENEFHQKRKELIKSKLKMVGLNQGDLAKLLGHRKGYMSELMNGLRPFSKEDIIVINRLLKIDLKYLIPTFIKQERANHIKKTLDQLSNSKIRLSQKDFDLQLA